MDDIADRAAAMGADRRLRQRMLAEAGDELGRVGQGFPAGEMDVVTQAWLPFSPPDRRLIHVCFQTAQCGRLTPDKSGRLCHGPAMSTGRSTQAGGFILALSILIGAIAGAALHQSSIGLLVGLGVGVVLALLIWVLDK